MQQYITLRQIHDIICIIIAKYFTQTLRRKRYKNKILVMARNTVGTQQSHLQPWSNTSPPEVRSQLPSRRRCSAHAPCQPCTLGINNGQHQPILYLLLLPSFRRFVSTTIYSQNAIVPDYGRTILYLPLIFMHVIDS